MRPHFAAGRLRNDYQLSSDWSRGHTDEKEQPTPAAMQMLGNCTGLWNRSYISTGWEGRGT